jgi:hypothetical protein
VERIEFDIKIAKDGKVVVEIHGSSGKKCMDLADMLREIVGREEERQRTAEYYGADGQVRINTQIHGRVKDQEPSGT